MLIVLLFVKAVSWCLNQPVWLYLSLVGAATSIIVVTTKHVFCRNKSMLAVTKRLSQQYYVCRNKIFWLQQNFVMINTCLLWQAYFCHDRTRFVATNIFLLQQHFCHDKYYVCHDKTFATTKDMFCHDRHVFVTTNMCLLWQNFCHDENVTCDISHQWCIYICQGDLIRQSYPTTSSTSI